MLPLTSASTSGGMEGELYTWQRAGRGAGQGRSWHEMSWGTWSTELRLQASSSGHGMCGELRGLMCC